MFTLRPHARLFAKKMRPRGRLSVAGRRVVFAAIFLSAGAYVVAPYVTIWRLAEALQQGDTSALETSIDWDDVREGIKEDIADGITGTANDDAAQAQSNDLPAFGASFVKSIASDMVDREIKPQHLSVVFQQMKHTGNSFESFLFDDVQYAFFEGFGRFRVSFYCPGQETSGSPVQVDLALQHYAWKVVRVRVPGTLSSLAPKRT